MWHKLSADNLDPDFVERRRVGLENFLLRVASHPVLSNDNIFFHFLTEVSKESPKMVKRRKKRYQAEHGYVLLNC